MDFKFEIGQRVRLSLDNRLSGMILRRTKIEYAGGVQNRYTIRFAKADKPSALAWFAADFSSSSAVGVMEFDEIELLPCGTDAPMSAIGLLREAKELCVGEQNFELADAIRKLIDQHRQKETVSSPTE